jgi:ribosome maturation factor RimP
MINNLDKTLKSMIEAEGFRFYDTQITKENEQTVFRILITKDDGHISIEDCVKVNHIVSPFLDVEEPMSGKYILEVSSAGIDRPLETPRHFQLSIGQKLKIKTLDKSKYIGNLLKVLDNHLVLDDKSIGETQILFSEIQKAKIHFSF